LYYWRAIRKSLECKHREANFLVVLVVRFDVPAKRSAFLLHLPRVTSHYSVARPVSSFIPLSIHPSIHELLAFHLVLHLHMCDEAFVLVSVNSSLAHLLLILRHRLSS